jgi:hypothetical protein
MNDYLCSPKGNWGVSSVGSERLLDRQEVTGSIPVHPTAEYEGVRRCLAPFIFYAGETGVKQLGICSQIKFLQF